MEPPKSSTSVLMSSLADQRLLSRIGKGRYRLRWRLFELGQTFLDVTEFRMEARRMMEDLVKCWDERAHLAVLNGLRAVYVEKLQPTPAVTIRGSREPVPGYRRTLAALARFCWTTASGSMSPGCSRIKGCRS